MSAPSPRPDGAPPGGLRDFLAELAAAEEPRAALARTLAGLAAAVGRVSTLLRGGLLEPPPASGDLAADAQGRDRVRRRVDARAHDIVLDELRAAGTVASMLSENEPEPVVLPGGGPFAVAVDPLDGSSNVDLGLSGGTIFGIFPADASGGDASFLRPGRDLLAAGYAIYGPHTALVLSAGTGVIVFRLDEASGTFETITRDPAIPPDAGSFAINVSNYRHWDEPVRTWVDHCWEGDQGPNGTDVRTHWVGSLVPEAHRVLLTGGVYLYPRDARPGYENGRVRYLYEAAPLAYLVEQARGRATDGVNRLLDRTPRHLHQRTPLIFGSSETVDGIIRYHTDPDLVQSTSPLFGRRGLFRS